MNSKKIPPCRPKIDTADTHIYMTAHCPSLVQTLQLKVVGLN